jgi:hypothetical protein
MNSVPGEIELFLKEIRLGSVYSVSFKNVLRSWLAFAE